MRFTTVHGLNFITTSITFSVAGHQEAKCLGYWRKSNLGSAKSVEANIEKARKAFFAAGAIGAYQGTLNPLSSISLFNTCVVPTLLYGSENWILTEQTIARLETFQSQMDKRILKIPKHYNANLLSRVTLQLPSMRVQILIRKLHFLAHLLTSNDYTLGPTTFRILAMCNVDDISLVQQCRWLESHFTHDSITDRCLRYPEEATSIVHKAELDLLKKDKHLTVTEASKHQSLKHILNIKCWLRVWDKALDRGCAATIAIQKLIRYLATPVFNDRCQYCTLTSPLQI